jgi:hypothetical protein
MMGPTSNPRFVQRCEEAMKILRFGGDLHVDGSEFDRLQCACGAALGSSCRNVPMEKKTGFVTDRMPFPFKNSSHRV